LCISEAAVYGSLTNLILSSLTWGLLIKTYFHHHHKYITLLKAANAASSHLSNFFAGLSFVEG
jgi:hypothetical protein